MNRLIPAALCCAIGLCTVVGIVASLVWRPAGLDFVSVNRLNADAGRTVPSVTIAEFAVNPKRIRSGQSTEICYAVAGAHVLRVVPSIGKLVRLKACQTLMLREPRRYNYTLSALGDRGQVAVRQVYVDVVASARADTRPAR